MWGRKGRKKKEDEVKGFCFKGFKVLEVIMLIVIVGKALLLEEVGKYNSLDYFSKNFVSLTSKIYTQELLVV